MIMLILWSLIGLILLENRFYKEETKVYIFLIKLKPDTNNDSYNSRWHEISKLNKFHIIYLDMAKLKKAIPKLVILSLRKCFN